MPDRRRSLGVIFLILTMLSALYCIFSLNDYDTYAGEVGSNTLESIANSTSIMESAQISVGKTPVFIGSNNGDDVYVANAQSGTVSVIDSDTNTVVKNIQVGESPTYITFFNGLVYVVNSDSNDISVIDPDTNTVVKRIPVGEGPVWSGVIGDYIYVANSLSDTVTVISSKNNTVIENIRVGEFPTSIDSFEDTDTIYVANSFSDTVTVISSKNNTVIKEIPVGAAPGFIQSVEDYVYVANTLSDTVSVIDPDSDTVITNITVGEGPRWINSSGTDMYVANSFSDTVTVIDPYNNTVISKIPVGGAPEIIQSIGDYVYVANYYSDKVSVINSSDNTVIKDIPVGEGPRWLYSTGTDEYVANSLSDSVSLINLNTHEVMSGVKFEVSPGRTGQIICDDLEAPLNRFLYVPSGSTCVAKPNRGFEFTGWVQNLGNNSTRTINATSRPPPSALGSFLGLFGFGQASDPAANFKVARFGNFTANFEPLPPPIPPQVLFSQFSPIAIALLTGLLIPHIIPWSIRRRQRTRLNSYHKRMKSVYDDGKLDENDIEHLNNLINEISDSYTNGRISSEYYTYLKKEISTLYDEIYKKKISSINNSNEGDANEEVLLDRVKEEIDDAYSKDKITELHYNLLNERITKMTSKGQ